ncbi:hypothetical protein CI109_102243 [Kwoniella shandongensis]|uniref:Uncharacterized protein n=1 Tax=Kwoniella shandongensis TaxID=1734106 RepID=A0A5M6C438_9TREE|nr:uncharacterized protein CI109_003603 [Kwoniella shandongensis]KAA5527949.1 hypothetical protein CI109_003603 [Kwoniella shandongensis]
MGQAIFIGCVASTYVVPNAVTIDIGSGQTSGCPAVCYDAASGPYIYSYLQASTNQCQCTNTGPDSTAYTESKTAGDSSCASASDRLVQITSSQSAWSQCASINFITTPYTSQGFLESPEACLQQCQRFLPGANTFFIPAPDGNSFSCGCSDSEGGSTDWKTAESTTCDNNVAFLYEFLGSATLPSGFAKRQDRNAKKRGLQAIAASKLCPGEMQACRLSRTDHSAGYECIDTSSELESCGGCLHGIMDDSSEETIGLDCSSLFGADPYSTTCISGVCKAFACTAGHELASNGTCI